MKVKSVTLILVVIFSGIFFGASHDYVIDIDECNKTEKSHKKNVNREFLNLYAYGACHNSNICKNIDDEVTVEAVGDLLWYRWFFRKTANISEAAGNTFFCCGAGLFTLAAASIGIYPSVSTYFLYSSTICNSLNILLFGVSLLSAHEVEKLEESINRSAKKVGFNVISLAPEIVNEKVINS